MTKCGRYGMAEFDYTPTRIRASVKRSLERLHTEYLDVVHLHDVEFVGTEVAPRRTGIHASALLEEKAAYGLLEGEEATVRGEGDQRILDAFAELQKMKDEGLIKHIGITGKFPCLSILVLIGRRLPVVYPPQALFINPSQPSIQARRCYSIIFQPQPAKQHLPAVRAFAYGAGARRAAGSGITF